MALTINNHLQKSLEALKNTLTEMADLNLVQLEDVITVLTNGTAKKGETIANREKRINEKELIIDSDCEKILALYGPVAIDLRLVLSVIEMNTHFERLGDLAASVAMSIDELPKGSVHKMIIKTKLKEHIKNIIKGIDVCMLAFNDEDISETGEIFLVNKAIRKDIKTIRPMLVDVLQNEPKQADLILSINQVARLVSRMSDMIDNIVEEIIFYVEAKVLKHKKKKYKVVKKHLIEKEEKGFENPQEPTLSK